jgi:hypothetical protein
MARWHQLPQALHPLGANAATYANAACECDPGHDPFAGAKVRALHPSGCSK